MEEVGGSSPLLPTRIPPEKLTVKTEADFNANKQALPKEIGVPERRKREKVGFFGRKQALTERSRRYPKEQGRRKKISVN